MAPGKVLQVDCSWLGAGLPPRLGWWLLTNVPLGGSDKTALEVTGRVVPTTVLSEVELAGLELVVDFCVSFFKLLFWSVDTLALIVLEITLCLCMTNFHNPPAIITAETIKNNTNQRFSERLVWYWRYLLRTFLFLTIQPIVYHKGCVNQRLTPVSTQSA